MKSKAILATATLAIIATSIIGCTDDDNAGAGPTPVELSATVTAPINNASVNDLVEITVDATDDKGIAKVEFFVNAIKIGEDAVAPYTIFWNASSLTHGSIHSIFAVAFDTDGNKFGTAPILCNIDTTMSAPQTSTFLPPTNLTDSSITLTWSQNTENDFASYIIARDTIADAPFLMGSRSIETASDTSVEINHLRDNVRYLFRLTVADIFGNLSVSSFVTARTKNIPPPQPTLASVIRQDTKLLFRWSHANILDFAKYEIIVSSDAILSSNDSALIIITDIGVTSVELTFSDTNANTFFLVVHDNADSSTASLGIKSIISSPNYALQFDGSQYATIPFFPALDLGDQYTLEAWVYMTSASEFMRVIDKSPPASPWLQYSLICDPRPGADVCKGNTPARFHSKVTVPLNEWHYVALTYDNGTINYYVDGNLQGISNTGITQTCAFQTTLNIGRRKMFDEFYFHGMIDEVRVWSSVRMPSEISATFNVRLSGNEPGLVCYYDFDEGAGDVISSPVGGNGHLGGISGADSKDPSWVTSTVPISN